jgi:hypothetical protein
MSEADRVFSRRSNRATTSSETRHIVTAPRKNRSGTVANRVVEVVHVAHAAPRPLRSQPHPVRRDAHAESWPDGFRARVASPALFSEAQPAVPEPTPPTVHVMPAWEPSAQQASLTGEGLAQVSSGTAAIKHHEQDDVASNGLKVTRRRFADPFAADENGANCIRCGYLVERARETRGLWTCSRCA